MTTIQFTPLEFEIIMHRLEVPECILEVFQDDYGIDEDFFWEALPKVDEKARAITVNGKWSMEILWETLAGSVYLALAEDEVSTQKLNALKRAFDSASDKIKAIAAE
jgi:hypothetical protein